MHSILLNNLASNVHKYWPMRVGESNSSTGFRIGGLPPIGVVPSFQDQLTKYFGTFPITGRQPEEMSIFCSFDYLDPSNPHFITNHTQKLIATKSKVIQCVFHKPSKRAKRSHLASELHGYAIKIGKESSDDPRVDPYSRAAHKIGGIPFLDYASTTVRGVSDNLLGSGYIHLLQWSYPGPSDGNVEGDWAFHNYIFHLYLKQAEKDYECKFILA